MSQKHHVMHGRDHKPSGSDPIGPWDSTENAGTDYGVRSVSTGGDEQEGYVLTATGDGGSVWAPATGILEEAFFDAMTTVAGSATLLGYWRLGDGAQPFADSQTTFAEKCPLNHDGSGVAMTDSIAGALASGQDDGAVQFNGGNSAGIYIDGNPSVDHDRFDLGVSGTSMSCAAWVNPTADANTFEGGVIGSVGGTSPTRVGWGMFCSWPTRRIHFFRAATGTVVDLYGPSLPSGEWTFVVCTYSTTAGATLYYNGAAVATDPTTFNTGASHHVGAWIGSVARRSGSQAYFLGGVDEASVWESALTADQVNILYQSAGVATDTGLLSVVSVAGAYTVAEGDDVILANGTFTVTLPTAVGISGREYTIKNTGSGTVTVDGAGSETIDGAATVTLEAGQSVSIVSDGINWASVTGGAITETQLSLSDVTTADVSTTKHGFAPKAPNDATKFLDGTGAWDTVKESDLSLSDITTNDVSTTKHGFVPKAPNDTAKFLRGDGTWAAASGGGGTVVGTDTIWDAKGDLAVGTAADTATKLSVGTDGYLLQAASGEATGVKWVSAAALGWDAVVRKAADESVSSSTTLQNDDELLFSTVSGGVYEIELVLLFTSAVDNTGNLKVALGEDSTVRGTFTTWLIDNNGTGQAFAQAANQTSVVNIRAMTVMRGAKWLGFANGNGGTWRVLWAQLTSSGNATTVKAGSVLRYRRVS